MVYERTRPTAPNASTLDGIDSSTFATDAEVTTAVADHAAAADPHTGYQKESERAAASGYASLDSDTRLPAAQTPTTVTTDTIAERTAAAGVTIDGVLLKDNQVAAAALDNALKSAGVYGSNRSSEGLNATITPTDTARPCFVFATMSVTLGSGANGNIHAKTDANATPTTTRQTVGGNNGNLASYTVRGAGMLYVRAGEKYRFDSETLAGSPTFSVSAIYEVPL